MNDFAPLLKDNELERQLVDVGYVVVPFFDEEQCQQMRDFFLKDFDVETGRMYASSHSSDIDYKYTVNDWIIKNYSPAVDRYFTDYRILGGTYIVKPGGGKGLIYPHQDWTLVDERRFRSVNCWVALVDTNKENGMVGVLPQSHTHVEAFRGPNVPERCKPIEDWLFEQFTWLPMKAGEALIYDHRLIHGSFENFTNETRVASACAVTNKMAERRVYYYHEGNESRKKIEEFEGNDDFLLSNDRFNAPAVLPSLGNPDYDDTPFVKSDFEAIIP